MSALWLETSSHNVSKNSAKTWIKIHFSLTDTVHGKVLKRKFLHIYAPLKEVYETPILLCKVNDFYPDLHNSTTGTWYMYRQIEKKNRM
jgi:hypothetical protein